MLLHDKVSQLLENCTNPKKEVVSVESNGDLGGDVLKVLLNKRFRRGPLPDDDSQKEFLRRINHHVEKDEPIPFYVLFGPNKNPYAQTEGIVDWSEFFAFCYLTKIYHSVKKVYSPSLDIQLLADDTVAVAVNFIEWDTCQRYIDSAKKLIEGLEISNIITEVIQYRELYPHFAVDSYLDQAEKEVEEWERDPANQEDLLRHREHARRHLVFDSGVMPEEMEELIGKAAHRYLVYRKAETMAGIREGDSALCATYSLYPGMLHIFSLGKSQSVQPWQGRGAILDTGKHLLPYCLSQKRIERCREKDNILINESPFLPEIQVVELISGS